MIPRQGRGNRAPRAGDSTRQIYQQDRASWLVSRRRLATRSLVWFVPATLLCGVCVGYLTRFAWLGILVVVLTVFGSLNALFQPPTSLVARRLRAAAEAGTGRALRPLERRGFTVLHDRMLLSAAGAVELAHVAIGPSGAYVIDSRNWLAGPKPRILGTTLWVGQQDQTGDLERLCSSARELGQALSAVVGGELDLEDSVPVTAVLAVHTAELPGSPREMSGVIVVRVEQLSRILQGARRLWSPGVVNSVAASATRLLPPRDVTGPADVDAMTSAAP